MPKKHKAKGGNQQKPQNNKGYKDKFSRDASGASSPYFSMRDEAMRTERHHSEWSPAVKLRHQGMRFVSAGNMNPLEESKDQDQDQEETTLVVAHLDGDLEDSDGALAQMHLRSTTAVSPPVQEQSMELDEDSAAVTLVHTLIQETQHQDTTQDSPPDLFVIDSVGDKSLAPPGRMPVIRDVSPSLDCKSDEEIVVFRGRSSRVTVRDDPPMPLSGPTPLPATAVPKSAGNGHLTDSVTASTVLCDESTPVSVISGANVVPVRSELPPVELKKQKSPPQRKKKGKGRKNKRQKYENIIDEPRSRASFGRIMDDPDMEEDDEEEAMLQDYIANMSDREQILSGLQRSDSDWISSVMDDEEEIEDEIEPASGFSKKKSGAKKRQPNIRSVPTTDVEMTDISAIPSDFHIDDEDEDDQDDGTSDPGDDTELESDLSYTERERWEDETDLRQRQIDAMTDEEIARMLAKQESLGMGSDELLLLDDSGFPTTEELVEAEADLTQLLSRSRPKPRRGNKKVRDVFPSASLMADVLDQDPYGGFDIMDFSRPSLRPAGKKGRKSAGPMPEELEGLSDEELIADLQNSWAADRSKKAARKAEREELRAEGLLGRGRADKYSRAPDLQVKFADGLSLAQLKGELKAFLDDDETLQKAMPPMEKKERKLLHEIANVYDLTSTSRGSGKHRFTVFSKRARTPAWDSGRWQRVEAIAQRGFIKGAGKGVRGRGEGPQRAGRGGGFSSAAVGYRNGEVVGATAPEIAESNFGRRLMEKMGWEKGKALGKGGEGMLLPVEAVIKSGRGGLG